MVATYRTDPSRLHAKPISAAHLAVIGRLIRACAEVEHQVVGLIAHLSGGGYDLCELMLGKTAISRRLKLAEQLAHANGPEALESHRRLFGAAWQDLVRVRNAAAHGHYVGRDDDGRYTFMVQDLSIETDTSPTRTALSVRGDHLKLFADDAEHIAQQLRDQGLPKPSHETECPPSLLGHPKGQRRNPSHTKPRRPPVSSQE